MTRRRVVVAAAGAVVVAVLAVVAFRPSGEPSTALMTGPAPAIDAVDLDGRAVRLADLRGQPVLVNFWATWCGPCRKEFPLLKAVHGKGVTVLGVVFEDSVDAARAFMEEEGATWSALQDPRGRIANAYGVGYRPGLPVTVAIDVNGQVVQRHVGELLQADLDEMVRVASGGVGSGRGPGAGG